MATPLLIEVKREFGIIRIYDYMTGVQVTEPLDPQMPKWLESWCITNGLPVQRTKKTSGELYWKKILAAEAKNIKRNDPSTIPVNATTASGEPKKEVKVSEPVDIKSLVDSYKPLTDDQIRTIVEYAVQLHPGDIFINDVKWKYLVHSIIRGRNTMMVGDSGAGKTVTAMAVAKALNRPFEKFNMGAMQDARASLIGNTHVNKDGTFFDKSLFIKSITTPGMIILLDEFTRGSHDAWNMLMPVLDPNQRYMRLDEKEGQETIPVAEGVCFLSTANIGRRYTATKILDDAMFERWLTIEMDVLCEDDEKKLLEVKFPKLGKAFTTAMAKIAAKTRAEARSEDNNIERYISTRMNVNAASLIIDGFTMAEAYDACVFPFFSAEGGADSERTFIIQVAQAHLISTSNPNTAKAPPANSPLFGAKDMAHATP